MKSVFAQTAEYRINTTLCSDCLKTLPHVIQKHTNWDYLYEKTDTGCFLKPSFRNIPYRNSFVPAIDIVISHDNAQAVLHMTGQPVKSVRIFMTVWFALLFAVEILLLGLAFTSKLDTLFPIFIPAIMCVFGYLLCKIAIKITFGSVVKALQKEFPS